MSDDNQDGAEMSIDRSGDPTKQPPDCEPRFIPYGPDNPKQFQSDPGSGTWTKCPNIKEIGGGMDGEIWGCVVCGKRYYLDYDEMR